MGYSYTMNIKFILQVLRLSQATLGSQSVGRIVTLASNDVQRFDFVGYYSCSMCEGIILMTDLSVYRSSSESTTGNIA